MTNGYTTPRVQTALDEPVTAPSPEDANLAWQSWLDSETAWLEVLNHVLRAQRAGDSPLAKRAQAMALHTAETYFGADGGAVVERATLTAAAAQRGGDTGSGDTAGVPSVLATLARALGYDVIRARIPGEDDPDSLVSSFFAALAEIQKENDEFFADEGNAEVPSRTGRHYDTLLPMLEGAVEHAEALILHLAHRGRLPSRWV